MMKHEDELSSIRQRLNSIKMTDSKRAVAMAAMRDASIIVDACAWAVEKIGQMRAALFLKPSLGH